MRVAYDSAKLLLPAFFPLLCRWEINGDRTSLPEGPVIVAANHLSNFDIPLLQIAIPSRISFMAQEELFKFPLGIGFRLFETFPVHRRRIDRKAFDKASRALKRKGWSLGMFPEGRKSPTAQLQYGHPGTALIALRNDAWILPVGLAGTEKVKERIEGAKRFLHRPVLTANIGRPFKLPSKGVKLTREHIDLCTDIVMRKLAELLPANYRGVYSDRSHTKEHMPADK